MVYTNTKKKKSLDIRVVNWQSKTSLDIIEPL